MQFIETRGNNGIKRVKVNFSEAILNPMASFGGLYIPESLPNLEKFFVDNLNSDYVKLAFNFLKKFEIDISDEVLREALNLYNNFDNQSPAPVVKLNENLFVNELYHGPTRAFKDMALQPFGYILSSLAKESNQNYLILAATSGDTGPATLETFKNRENVKVVCLYPEGGTSDVQRLQMVTEDGENLKVIGIKGDFDDAQNALKSLLSSSEFREELKAKDIALSAANSVNFGRIIFQIIYHINSYLELIRTNEIEYGEKIYITIPSGNFGNALGAYYAKKMGLPVKKILITSNQNNILTDLITKGEYDLNSKTLTPTESPAMDILKSSNVERVLFDKFGAKRVKELMDDLVTKNCYKLTPKELEILREDFDATFSSDSYGREKIKEYLDSGYLMDPHTATCIKAIETLKEKNLKTIICSTAEWTKFSPTVMKALGGDASKEDLEALKYISKEFKVEIPNVVQTLFSKEIVHKDIIEKEDISKAILDFINKSSKAPTFK